MANEKRLIDANALLKAIDCCDIETYDDKQTIEEQIALAPTVDAVEVVHGRWLDGKLNYITLSRGNHICSNCRSATGVVKFNYCPNCGAKMDGGNEDG